MLLLQSVSVHSHTHMIQHHQHSASLSPPLPSSPSLSVQSSTTFVGNFYPAIVVLGTAHLSSSLLIGIMIVPLSVSVLLSLFVLTVQGGQSSIQNATVYTDSACTQVFTLDTSWQFFGNLSYSEVDNTYVNSFGPCVNAFTPSVASGQFACVISTVEGATYNGSLYTLSTQEWTSNSGCPSTPAANIRYYFSGRSGLCVP